MQLALVLVVLAVVAGVAWLVLKLVRTQLEGLRKDFGLVAAEELAARQTALEATNHRSVETLFASLKDKLDRYEKEVTESSRENRLLGNEMKTQIGSLQRFTEQAGRFTAALVGGNKLQGNQGEAILASILEQSGLKAGVQYDTQVGEAGENRPDVCIYDALNQHVILVDAKMNIKDYIAAYNLPDDEAHKEEKKRALRAHVQSVKRQIDNLASKNYPANVAPKREGYTNLPLVAMFCPFNTILEAALIEDPTLMQYAFDRSIVLVTPLTLWGYLWLIAYGWRQRAVERKFDDIQALGQKVVEAVDAAYDDFAKIGEALDEAKAHHEMLMKRLDEKGRVSLKRVATDLLNYGVTPAKKLKRLAIEPEK